MMVQARAALEKIGCQVVGAEMAITMLQRIASKGSPAMSNVRRLELLTLACEPHRGWLRAADGSRHHSAGKFIQKEADRLQQQYGAGVEFASVRQ